MEKFGLKSTFPYEYGSDFKITRLDILNSTRNETAFLFYNFKRVITSAWKYSYTFFNSLFDSSKFILNHVVTIGSRDVSTRLQIDASKDDNQEDIWASTILLGIIIGILISCFGRKYTLFKSHRNSVKVDKCNLRVNEPTSIVINIMGNTFSNDDNLMRGNNVEIFMAPQLNKSIFNIHIPNIEVLNETDKILKHDIFGEYYPLNGETATEAMERPNQQLSANFKAESDVILFDSMTRGTHSGITKRICNERREIIHHSVGDDGLLPLNIKQSMLKSSPVPSRLFVPNNVVSTNGQVCNIPAFITEALLGNELFLTMPDKEIIFFRDSIPLKKIGMLEEKEGQLEEVIHKELVCYNKNRSLAKIYQFPKIKEQRSLFMRQIISIRARKILVNEKDAASILLWFSTDL